MQVLYIAGAGRSGSTLLEMILGNLPGLFSVGEVRYFWDHMLRGSILCGCGVEVSQCELWSAVGGRLASDASLDFERLAELSKQWNRTRSLVKPQLGQGVQELVSGTERLYRAIAEVAQHEALVDTSKAPSHLALLKQIPSIDLSVLHLVRDGRAVAYSWNKRAKQEHASTERKARMPRRAALRAVLTWSIENLFVLGLRRSLPHTTVHYERFVQDPQRTLERALAQLGIKQTDLGFSDSHRLTLSPTHSMGGNPVRFAGTEISIVPDEEWERSMPRGQKVALGLVALPMLLRFGYRL